MILQAQFLRPLSRARIETCRRFIDTLFRIVCEIGTAKISDDHIAGLVADHFDLRPGTIIHDLGLRKPIYRQTAAYGHFGRDDIQLSWERTDKADALKSTAGL